MRKILKYIGYTLLTIVSLILLYLGCAWALSRLSVSAESNTAQQVTIYIKSSPVITRKNKFQGLEPKHFI
jgi:hypothetical protein